jgi:pyrophosphatase PpaX
MPLVKFYEGHLELISLLRQDNKRVGIVTTSAHSVIDQLLNKHAMAELFDVVVGGDDVLNQKPHAEPITKAIAALSAVRSRTLMIGDSDKDIVSAQNAGIDSILFYPPEHSHFHDITYLRSLGPTYIVGSFQEIGSLLSENSE